MTEETPAKVFSLLGVALTSMFFLFAVTATNASFTQTEKSFPTTFNPENVLAVIDSAASGYSKFIGTYVIEPERYSFAVMQYNLNYVIDEASPAILALTGLTALAEINPTHLAPRSQVAGAFTRSAVGQGYVAMGDGLSINSLYALLIR